MGQLQCGFFRQPLAEQLNGQQPTIGGVKKLLGDNNLEGVQQSFVATAASCGYICGICFAEYSIANEIF
jgi:hypothetical protein